MFKQMHKTFRTAVMQSRGCPRYEPTRYKKSEKAIVQASMDVVTDNVPADPSPPFPLPQHLRLYVTLLACAATEKTEPGSGSPRL